MKNRRKPALAVRLYVDAEGLTFWDVYERSTDAVLMRLRTCPVSRCHGNTQLARVLAEVRAS